jgi:anthranilate synthase/aminodeoxychorismate synthase-like glutamine amidotransferase
MAMIEAFSGRVPVLGVCLGHQALAAVFGSSVGAAQSLMHGKASPVYHDRRTIFEGLSNPFPAGRYHSLAVAEEGLGSDLMISAYTSEGEIMGVRHRHLPLEGVQFHPESLLTPAGDRLLHNFLDMAPIVMHEPLKTSAI